MKYKGNRRTKKRKGGSGPKVIKLKTAKVPTPEIKARTLDDCPICLLPMPTNTMKTACGHKFHKNCLKNLCNSDRPKVCPLCRRPIVHDCVKILPPPGQFMPEKRQENIIKYENRIRNMMDGEGMTNMQITRMTNLLKLLKFPSKFGTTEWNKMNYFSEAFDKSLNQDTVVPMAIEMVH